jgi:hypothetical protein
MFLNLNLTTIIKLKTCEFELYNFRSEIPFIMKLFKVKFNTIIIFEFFSKSEYKN